MSDENTKPMSSTLRSPLATQDAVAREPAPFPVASREAPQESQYPDWRRRLLRNLSRRSDGRWEPLTRTHADEPASNAD